LRSLVTWIIKNSKQLLPAPGTEFRVASIELGTSTGTYLDTPQHRFPEGDDSGGLANPEAIGSRGISIHDLDWRPNPLPNTDAAVERIEAERAVVP
jgi:kynurenine formamidase